MRGWLFRMGVVAALLLAGLVGVGAFAAASARARVDQAREVVRSDWTRLRSAVLREQQEFQDDPLVAHRDGPDVAPILSSRLRWALTGGRSSGVAPVPEVLRRQLETWKQWTDHVDEATLEGVELDWLSGLSSYGYWDVEADPSPVLNEPFNIFAESMPNFIDLQHVAKARLLVGLRSGDVRSAAAEVRELARLSLTTETLVGEMVGVGLLNIERAAYDEAVRRRLDVAGWTPVSEERASALRRALWSANVRTSLLAPSEVVREVLPVGQCAALREALGSAWVLRRYAAAVVPDRYEALQRELSSAPCRLLRARRAFQSAASAEPPASHHELCATFLLNAGLCDIPSAATSLPFVRSFIGARLLSTDPTDWLSHYRALAGRLP